MNLYLRTTYYLFMESKNQIQIHYEIQETYLIIYYICCYIYRLFKYYCLYQCQTFREWKTKRQMRYRSIVIVAREKIRDSLYTLFILSLVPIFLSRQFLSHFTFVSLLF